MENGDPGSIVAILTVRDADGGEGGNVRCSVDRPEFELTRGYGRIQTTRVLDRELEDGYQLTITCSDHGEPPLSSTAQIYVIVGDVNDNVPQFDSDSYTAEILENNYIGVPVITVNASDADAGSNQQIHYRLANGPHSNSFNIDGLTGVITARAVFDREDVDLVPLVVEAVDNGHPSLTGTTNIIVGVVDVNDVSPSFLDDTYSFGVYENQEPGTQIGVVSAVDLDSPMYSGIR